MHHFLFVCVCVENGPSLKKSCSYGERLVVYNFKEQMVLVAARGS